MGNIIAMMTDFGLDDNYVGVMKGVILNIDPDAQIVDITHAIRPQNVREGAFTLMNSYHYFPQGTTFCVVVDPGVGSMRVPIAVKAGGYHFIAPDNGVLSYTLSAFDHYEAVAIENPAYQLSDVSQTFHGRDIFSPASAYIARGDVPLSKLGKTHDALFTFPKPDMTHSKNRITGEVMHVDHFGNIITSIGKFSWRDPNILQLKPYFNESVPELDIDAEAASITIHSYAIHGIARAYYEVHRGNILCQIDSNGFLEIAANQDNAAHRLDVELGDKVVLSFGK